MTKGFVGGTSPSWSDESLNRTRTETYEVQYWREIYDQTLFSFENLTIFSLTWEKSKNMNYELDYNGVINLTDTVLKEYFDGFLSFQFQFRLVFRGNIFTLWIETSQSISFKSACMSRFQLLCRTAGLGRLFYKEMEMRQIYIKVFSMN